MKKISLFISLMLLSIVGLTSCLQRGSTKSGGYAYGVLTTSTQNYAPVLNSIVGIVSSPQLTEWSKNGNMIPGYCYYFKYEIDHDIPENSSASSQANGYYTVTITEIYELPTYTVNWSPADTTTVLPGEIPVLNAYASLTYAGGYAYIQQIVNQPSDMRLNWSMSYDYNSISNPTEENGVRYYDLFVRAIGEGGTKPKVDTPYLNAYNMSNFFGFAAENEKKLLGANYNNSSSTFSFRIFYVKEIKEDGILTWESHTDKGLISLFVSE
jgi:hypothetical protein